MKRSIAFAAAAILVAAGARWQHSRRSASLALSPAEKQSLHDAPNGDQEAPKIDLQKFGLDSANAAPVAAPPAASPEAGNVAGNDPSAGKTGAPVEWVSIGGGKFTMGTDNDMVDAFKPSHAVTIATFEMSKTLITVDQYAECVGKGACTKPGTYGYCNWGKTDRDRTKDPVNCVDWDQANQYAKFKGARLPSESEWEYAAKSAGKDQMYPWGDEFANCERAVMATISSYGCGSGSTLPVCSKPAGNTAQGLCDMGGNLLAWVQDKWHASYTGAPADGSAWEGQGSYRVVRGGAFNSSTAELLRTYYRDGRDAGRPDGFIGFRLAR